MHSERRAYPQIPLWQRLFRCYGAELSVFCLESLSYSTHKPTFTLCAKAMRIVLRWALPLILATIAAFCSFGFLASGEFEPAGSNAFRVLYRTAVVVCVGALVADWRVKTRGRCL
jgi:hypothetical protein